MLAMNVFLSFIAMTCLPQNRQTSACLDRARSAALSPDPVPASTVRSLDRAEPRPSGLLTRGVGSFSPTHSR